MTTSAQIDHLIKILPGHFAQRPAVIRSQVPFKEYTEWQSVNASLLKEPTPAHMLHYMTKDREETEALVNGQLLHAATFEPDTVESLVIALPDDAPKKPSSRQREAKKPSSETTYAISWWDEFNARAEGKHILPQEDIDRVFFQRDAIFRHHFARKIIESPGRSEASIEIWDDQQQVMRKARYDRLPGLGASFLLDLKSTRRELNPWDMRSEVLSRGYHLQAKSYLDCLEMATGERRRQFFFVFVRNEAPFVARVYELGAEMLAAAEKLLYATDTTQPGRLPMFCNAAREFIQRVQEKHADPLGAWEAYEHEDPQILDM